MTSLWEKVVLTTERAIRKGSLVTVPTEHVVIRDQGVDFVVHVTTLQAMKADAKASPAEGIGRPFNPFLPPDPDLVVSDLEPRHISVLNKFNVIPHHLLIVTRHYEAQETLLTTGDFAALLAAMNEMDGLGFYNGGKIAGASQGHKHLQLIPLPLGEGPLPTPIDSVIGHFAETGVLMGIPAFDFPHALIPLEGGGFDSRMAGEIHDLYLQACVAVGVHDETSPYNLLLTRRWMLLVPRSREHWLKVSLNALAFAGSLLVRNQSELGRLREVGPLAVLKSVVEPDPM